MAKPKRRTDTPAPAPAAPTGSRTREEIEAREDRDLAPWATRVSRSQGRRHPEPEHPFRTAYMRDRDRVIHSAAFRRLEYKTQVFANHEGDGYRTRLTHTMEVAQVSRTAARALRLNEDLVEAIALSHDLGHGPFGHAGEAALKEAASEHGGFEHNAHGLRVVDALERRAADFRGLNLTHEVREAFAMHSPRDKTSLGFERRRPALEAQLVDVCDNLTYTAHDLDDGISSGCVTPQEMCAADLWRETWERVGAQHPSLETPLRVGLAVKGVIDACVVDLLGATAARLEAAKVRTSDDVRAAKGFLVGFSDAFGRRQRELSRLLHERFYRHPRLVRAAAKARLVVFTLYAANVREPAALDPEWRAWASVEGTERAVVDWIASMTDRRALEEYGRIVLP